MATALELPPNAVPWGFRCGANGAVIRISSRLASVIDMPKRLLIGICFRRYCWSLLDRCSLSILVNSQSQIENSVFGRFAIGHRRFHSALEPAQHITSSWYARQLKIVL